MNTKTYTAIVKAKKSGDWGWEDSTYPRSAWVFAVVNGDTQLGYFDWVIHNLEANEEP